MGRVPRLLYIDSDTDVAADRAETLSSAYELTVHTASDVTTAKAVLDTNDIDCVVSEFRLGKDDGFDLLSHVRSEHGSLPVILLIDDEPEHVARDAFKSGATDLFPRSMLELSYDPLVDRINELTDTAIADSAEEPTANSVDKSAEPVEAAASTTAKSDGERTPTTVSTTETATSTDGGGTEAVAGGSSSPADTDATDTTAVDTAGRSSNGSARAAESVEADSLSALDLAELRELPKDELITLLAEIIGEDDEPATESAERMAETIDTDDAADSQAANAAATETVGGSASTAVDEPEPTTVDEPEPTTDNRPTVNETAAEPDADETTWETNEGYRRPAGLDLSPGTTTLVQCGSQDARKHDARRDLLGVTEAANRNILLIQYRAMNPDRLAAIAEAAQRVKVITVGCSQTVPTAVSDTVEVVNINNPNDVTRLGILSTKTLDDWQPLDGEIAVSLDPLDVLFQYKSVEGTFRFLHIFLGKLSAGSAVSSFFVNPSSSNPQDVNTLKPLFDHILTVDAGGVDLEGT